jgi:hypothetical protein
MILNKRLTVTLALPSWESLPLSLAVAIIAAFITTLEGVDTRHAGNVTQPGTIGLAKPHPPLDRAPGRACSRLVLRHLFKFSDAIVIRSTLSKWLEQAARKTGKPNLVLAMISMLLAATIVFFLRGIFGS